MSVLLLSAPRTVTGFSRWLLQASLLAGAAMVATSAAIHLHLWLIGYRNIHLIGPAFILQAVSGFVLALALLVFRRLGVLIAGVLFCVGSVVALLLSATVGFLGLHDGLTVPWAGWSLAVEAAGAVVLAGCAAVFVRLR